MCNAAKCKRLIPPLAIALALVVACTSGIPSASTPLPAGATPPALGTTGTAFPAKQPGPGAITKPRSAPENPEKGLPQVECGPKCSWDYEPALSSIEWLERARVTASGHAHPNGADWRER